MFLITVLGIAVFIVAKIHKHHYSLYRNLNHHGVISNKMYTCFQLHPICDMAVSDEFKMPCSVTSL